MFANLIIFKRFPEIMYTIADKKLAICNLVEEWFSLLNINIWISIYFCCSLLIVHMLFCVWKIIWCSEMNNLGMKKNFETCPLKTSIVYFISHSFSCQFLSNNFFQMNQYCDVQEGTKSVIILLVQQTWWQYTKRCAKVWTPRWIDVVPALEGLSFLRHCCRCLVKGGWY